METFSVCFLDPKHNTGGQNIKPSWGLYNLPAYHQQIFPVLPIPYAIYMIELH
jgi:hypothetical protein